MATGGPSAMRQVNRSLVLDAVRAGAPLSRSDLARVTGLARPTVSAIVGDLLADGTVREVGMGEATAVGGRRPRLLAFNEAAVAYVGCHFGVHRTTVALADARGRIRATRWRASIQGDPRRSLAQAVDMMDRTLRDARLPLSRVAAVGVAVPGPVERATGTCVVAPNLKWADFPVRSEMEAAVRLPVGVQNNIHAGALAEARVGAGTGFSSFAWLYVGSGIGAGLVIDGQVLYGHAGYSGEVGHCVMVEEGEVCGCGRRGCLETVASGTAIAKRAVEAVAAGEETLLAEVVGELDATTVAGLANQGDATARRVLAEAGDYLGRGASYLINIINPQLVVVGGNMARAGEALIGPLRESMGRHTFGRTEVPVVPSSLGSWAEVTGAVQLAMEQAAPSYRIVTFGSNGVADQAPA